ncbi:MAG: PAS domain S-box protein [Syntrophales bacterium]|nr:PAS domain S-box protein [Syntrophales bacterium]
MKLNIRGKIILISVAILFLGIGANALINGIAFTREYTRALQSETVAIGQSLKSQLDRLLGLGIPIQDLVGFEEQCRELLIRHKGISYAMILDLDGKILFHNDPSRHDQIVSDRAMLKGIRSEKSIVQVYPSGGERFYDVIIPVSDRNNRHVAAVRIGFPEKLVSSKTGQMVAYSLVVALVFLGLATLLLLVSLNVWVTKPLSRLIAVIHDIREKGTESAQLIEIDSRDEIGQLGSAFNQMVFEIKESHQKIKHHSNQLEQKIQERTAELKSINKHLELELAERKRIEEALRESEKKYRTILEEMEEGYYEVDLAGSVTFFNEAVRRIFGFSADEFMGMGYAEYTSLETAKSIYKTFNKACGTGKPVEISDYEIIKKDNSKATLELYASLMKNKREEPVGFRGIVRDITPRKKIEEEIKSHREHLTLINQILRHDLTNDLVVIQSAINLYNKSPEDEFLKEIFSRTEKSLELIGRMRELESFISRHAELQICEIRDAIDEIVKSYPFIDFKVKGSAQVMADNTLVSVIDNITRNAVIHGRADRIEVTIGRRKDMCEIRIADNGSGIPDEIKEKIFEEGFMYGDTGHTGLGLHIVKKAMEKYGGYVYAEDNKPRGASFVLMFKAI